jgi:hypothetical protein
MWFYNKAILIFYTHFLLNTTFEEIFYNLELHIATLLSNIYLKLETSTMHNNFYSISLIN